MKVQREKCKRGRGKRRKWLQNGIKRIKSASLWVIKPTKCTIYTPAPDSVNSLKICLICT